MGFLPAMAQGVLTFLQQRRAPSSTVRQNSPLPLMPGCDPLSTGRTAGRPLTAEEVPPLARAPGRADS